jgi:hypothetical protein
MILSGVDFYSHKHLIFLFNLFLGNMKNLFGFFVSFLHTVKKYSLLQRNVHPTFAGDLRLSVCIEEALWLLCGNLT